MFKQMKIDLYTAEINIDIDKFNQTWMNVHVNDDLCNLFEIF